MDWNLDFGSETAEQFEKSAGLLADGWYRAKLISEQDETEDGSKKLQFQVSYGPQNGKKITEGLKNPTFITDEKKALEAMRRAKIWAKRLGAVPAQGTGSVKTNWAAALGVEFVIHIKSRSFTGSDGKDREYTGIDYAGVFPLDHLDIPADVRAELGLPAVEGGAGPRKGTAAAAAAGAKGGAGAAGGTSTSPAGATPGVPQQSVTDQAKALFGG